MTKELDFKKTIIKNVSRPGKMPITVRIDTDGPYTILTGKQTIYEVTDRHRIKMPTSELLTFQKEFNEEPDIQIKIWLASFLYTNNEFKSDDVMPVLREIKAEATILPHLTLLADQHPEIFQKESPIVALKRMNWGESRMISVMTGSKQLEFISFDNRKWDNKTRFVIKNIEK